MPKERPYNYQHNHIKFEQEKGLYSVKNIVN